MSLFGTYKSENTPRKYELNKTLVNHYQLSSKDMPLVDFTYTVTDVMTNGIPDKVYDLKITRIYDENLKLKPFSLSEITDSHLLHWLEKRKAPTGRAFMDKVLSSINENGNPLKYLEVTHALSVNDAFWVNNLDYPLRWADINLYSHKVDTVLANIAFTGASRKLNGKHYSPELTTNGNQKKCWVNIGDTLFLRKGMMDFFDRNDRSDVYSEYYAAQVASVLEIDHVDYELDLYKHQDGSKEITSLCPAFTDENTGYIPICYLLNDELLYNLSSYRKELEIGEIYGREHFEDMMLFDSIILNVDRHLGNFGMLFDTNTGEILGPAPLFDHGNSLMSGAAGMNFKDFDKYLQEVSNPYEISFDEMMKRFVQQRHLSKIRKLLEFEFTPHPQFGDNTVYLSFMSNVIRQRAQKALSLYREKEHYKKQASEKESLKVHNELD